MTEAEFDIHPDMYATTGEAAHILGITAATLRRWANQGRIAHVRDPNGWRLYRGGDIYALREHPSHRPVTNLRVPSSRGAVITGLTIAPLECFA